MLEDMGMNDLRVVAAHFNPAERTLSVTVNGYAAFHALDLNSLKEGDTVYLIPGYAMNDLLDEYRALKDRIGELESEIDKCRNSWASIRNLLEGKGKSEEDERMTDAVDRFKMLTTDEIERLMGHLRSDGYEDKDLLNDTLQRALFVFSQSTEGMWEAFISLPTAEKAEILRNCYICPNNWAGKLIRMELSADPKDRRAKPRKGFRQRRKNSKRSDEPIQPLVKQEGE